MKEQKATFLPVRKFLIVDNDHDALHRFTVILHDQGYEVQACNSYSEALECLGTGTYDFILVDQGSPDFEGRVVLDRAIEINRNTPVLVVSRFLDMACYLDAMYMGAVDYVVKPIPGASLARIIGTHLPQRCAAA